jgi:uncharacterized protein (TIGR02391 family)
LTAEQLRDLPTEELALALLAELDQVGPNDRHLRNFTFLILSPLVERPPYQVTVVTQQQVLAAHGALAERIAAAWQWMLGQGYIAPDPQQSGNWVNVTSAGREALTDPNFMIQLNARQLLGRELDQRLEKARRTFEAGDYDTAVHQALKEVEVTVRAAGSFSQTDLGVDLMTKAFRPESGPLADTAAPLAEQEGVMQLFRGAFAAYRNPVSHRHIDFADPGEAAEVVLMANLLMRITDRAAAVTAATTSGGAGARGAPAVGSS